MHARDHYGQKNLNLQVLPILSKKKKKVLPISLKSNRSLVVCIKLLNIYTKLQIYLHGILVFNLIKWSIR